MPHPGPPPPFALQHTPQVPELLRQLGCTIAISTYQAGKLIFLSAIDEHKLIQLPRSFSKPMGIAEDVSSGRLALACKDEIILFSSSAALAQHYPKAPDRYDSMFLPRCTYHTGPLDIHDLNFGDDGKSLYAVNTRFSCLIRIDDQFSFTPYWQPPFIDELASEDRCHLNGMAMQDGRPKYATTFSQTNTPQGWRPTVTSTGTIYDVASSEVITSGLAMPHSPRLFNGELFVLLSATGELARVDIQSGKTDIVCRIGGFVRGMSLIGDYLFVGLSKLRKNSSTFAKLDFAEKANQSGIAIIHLPTGSKVGSINYLSSVDEIYDVHLLAGKQRPNILNTLTDDYHQALMIPETTYWAKPKKA